VPIVCEIDSGSNVSFLVDDSSVDADPEKTAESISGMTDNSFTMLAPFAAGAVYVDSLQDKLAVQAFYNVNLLRIIRELVVGQAEEELYKEPNVSPSHLTFTPVPARFHGKSYIQLFQHLIVNRMAIPLGLYRSTPWGIPRDGNLPYVITNPNADLLVQADDFVYTLDRFIMFLMQHLSSESCSILLKTRRDVSSVSAHFKDSGPCDTAAYEYAVIARRLTDKFRILAARSMGRQL